MSLVIDLQVLPSLAEAQRDNFEVMLYQLQGDDDIDEETIDAIADSIAQPIIDSIDCKECGNCCRNLDVQLGEDDLERLANGIHVPIAEIRENVLIQASDDPDIVGIFKAKPCSFLKGNLCSVYEHRPTSCRDYPQFTPDFRWMLGWMIEGAHLCPIIYNVLLQMLEHVDDLQRSNI